MLECQEKGKRPKDPNVEFAKEIGIQVDIISNRKMRADNILQGVSDTDTPISFTKVQTSRESAQKSRFKLKDDVCV